MHAALWGGGPAVPVLLERGADVNAKGVRGETALIIAAANGSRGVVRALPKRGARVNDEDSEGKTALDYAEANPDDKTKAEIARMLKESGAK